MNPITLRRWHSYIGAFVAPSVLFFTLTGALQLFNLHEAHGNYHPPVLLERLSSVHKDQVLNKHEEDETSESAGPPPASDRDGSASGEPHEQKSTPAATLGLKIFFLVVALGLTLSTCFGVWMSLQTPRKRLPLVLLLTGALLPIILLVI